MEDTTDWYGPDSATFGDRLAAAREAAGMTQDTLAKRLGVKLRTLQNWENDLSEPRANRLSMMAGMVNVSMVWLINGEGEGLDDPHEETIPTDINDILLEMRHLRAEFKSRADRLGQLEKRLRLLLKDPNT